MSLLGAAPAPSAASVDRQAAAQQLLRTAAPRYMTWPALLALWMMAIGDRQLSPARVSVGGSGLASGGVGPSAPSFLTNVTQSVANGQLKLAPGQYMRNLEFPTLASFGTTLYAAWNDGAGGHSHIRLVTSTDNGVSWSLSWVTQGSNDELQPALSSDTALHLLYYHRNNDNTLDVLAADSGNGTRFTTRRVTTRSSPGVFTVPQFDPAVATPTGRLHRQRQRRRPPVLRVGRQPRHHNQLHLAQRPARPERVLRQELGLFVV